ncbi:MAG TPA: ABC transporter substrate-binding protein [Burkholderiales bacterium]|nr:ABC transporter substrate-binding protein [Burkholderiales bacterium]
MMKRLMLLMLGLAAASSAPAVLAQKKYDTGANDTEIRIGSTNPYSGPASAYGTIGRTEAAYFRMINDQGGINGRKITFISLDDGYSPPRTVEQVRKLVEQDQVLFLAGTLGTPPNSAIHKYVNARGIPHIFVNTGATKWGDPKNFPWTMGFNINYQAEGGIYARYILDTKPDAKIAILFQNDDYGKDYVKGLKDGLGDKAAKMIVAEASYEVTDPTVDSQIVTLKASGADTFYNVTTPKFAAQAIRKVHDMDWRPLHILNNVSLSVGSVLTPAGLDKSVGLITAAYYKDPLDPQWQNDPAMKEYSAWFRKYYPEGDIKDAFNVTGYLIAQGVVHVLKACGDDLTRANVMKQMASIRDLQLPMMLPGIKWNTSADDYFLIESAQLARFDGKEWVRFGPVLGK